MSNLKPEKNTSVSWGTHNLGTLCWKFCATLEYFRPKKFKNLIAEARELKARLEELDSITQELIAEDEAKWAVMYKIFNARHYPTYSEVEASDFNEIGQKFWNHLLEKEKLDDEFSYMVNGELMDALDSIAPKGTMFSTHPGDGADFGFWEVEEW